MVLTELRKIYKMSMQELADNICVSKALIGHIEKGKREISDEVLSKLVSYFGLYGITKDYKQFLTKDSMDEIEVLKVRKAKIENESELIETEETDPETGEKYIGHYNTMDETGYIMTSYEIDKKEFIRKIEKKLIDIIDTSMEEQERSDGFASIEQAVSEASGKIVIYEKIVDLEAKANKDIFKNVMWALTMATTGKGIDSDAFVRKLVKVIKAEIDRKEKERQEYIRLFTDFDGFK